MHDVYWGRETRVRALLEWGADVNAKNVEGSTALIIAAAGGKRSIVRVLLERSARVNEKDIKGKTALDYVQDSPDDKAKAEIARLLKRAGAK
jgi:ankyrin repeat protein